VDVENVPDAGGQPALICPRDGARVIELKEKTPGVHTPPTEVTAPVVTGWWCEAGHRLELAELPVETDGV